MILDRDFGHADRRYGLVIFGECAVTLADRSFILDRRWPGTVG